MQNDFDDAGSDVETASSMMTQVVLPIAVNAVVMNNDTSFSYIHKASLF